MSNDQPDPWSEEGIALRVAAAVEQHVPALAALVSPEEATDLKSLCLEAFEFLIYVSHADDADVFYGETIPKAVQETLAKGAGDLRQALADHRILRRLGALGTWIHGHALEAARKTLELTPELREAVREKHRELVELLRELKARHPHLEDERLPRPVFVISYPKSVGRLVSSLICDFRYVRDYPGGRVMSIDLAHEVGHLPFRSGNGPAPGSETKDTAPQ